MKEHESDQLFKHPPGYPFTQQISDALEFFDDYRCLQAMEALDLVWTFAEGEGKVTKRLPSRAELRSRVFTLLREAAKLPVGGAIHREYFLAIKLHQDRLCVVFAPYGADTMDINFDEPEGESDQCQNETLTQSQQP
jgi:hypothetical protein